MTRWRRSGLWLVLFLVLLADTERQTQAQSTQAESPIAQGEMKIEGIVVDPIGAGASNAQVRIELPNAAADDPPLAQSQTGNNGRIAITLKKPATDQVRFRITKDGFAEFVGSLDISSSDEPPFIDATLGGAARITGKITSASTDKPIAGVDVECNNRGQRLVTQTVADGTYSFDSIYAGQAVIVAKAAGYAIRREIVKTEDKKLQVDLQLQRERPIELTVVTNTKTPAEEATVEAIIVPGDTGVSATSDAQGKAVLHGVGWDAVMIRMRVNGPRYLAMRTYTEELKLPKVSTATTREDDAPISPEREPSPERKTPPSLERESLPAPFKARLTVTLASRVTGKVVDKVTNKPVSDVRIVAGHELRYDMPVDWTDAEGSYELVGVRPGIVTVTFGHDDYATAIQTIDLHTGKTGTLDATLDPGVPVGGVVVDDKGKPVEHVRVTGDNWQAFKTLGLRAVTGADGRFSFPHVPSGEIEFTFVRPGYGEPKTDRLASGKTDLKIVLEGANIPTTAPDSDRAMTTKLQPGQLVPDLKLTATDGTVYKLSELQGKYVMLDFWASWCGPCIAELPQVKAVYDATKDRPDFVLIGVSLDTDAAAMKKACQNKGITWPQVFGPKSGAAETFEAFDGFGIPYICLIGPDGKLITQHLRGQEMVEQVKKHLPVDTANAKDKK